MTARPDADVPRSLDDDLREGALAFGLELSERQLRQFDRLSIELLDWNSRFNLTAITDPRAVTSLHFLDSLACLLAPIAQGAQVIDVGAGAGFPGLPLAIARPDLRVTLLEATAKKARFLEHAATALDLRSVRVVNDRAETAGTTALREAFDVAVARALASMPALLELTLPFCRLAGNALALKKGLDLGAELQSSADALRLLGGELTSRLAYTLGAERREVVVVRKARPTPLKYPRSPGLPAKRPLGTRSANQPDPTSRRV